MLGDFDIGGCSVYVRANRIRRGGEEIRVRPRSMLVLLALARSDDVVTKNELVDGVWHGAEVSQDVLTQSIVELRKALGDDARDPHIIETIHRVGYRLLVKPEPISTQKGRRYSRASLWAASAVFIVAALPGIRYWFTSTEPSDATTEVFSGLPDALTSKADAMEQYLLGKYFLKTQLGSWLADARTAFESAIANDPTLAEAYAGLAYSFLIFDETPRSYSEFDTDLARAKALILRALEINPASAETFLVVAQIARLETDVTAEERALRDALAADPGLVDAHIALGEHLASRIRLNEAFESFEAARAIDPGNPRIAVGMAKLTASRGDYDGAVALLVPVVERSPSPAVYSALLTLAAEFGDYINRLRWAIDWVRLTPRSAVAAAELGDAYTELGASEFALAWLRHANSISPQAAFKAEMRYLMTEQQYDAMLTRARPALPVADDVRMSPDQSAPTALAGLTSILLGEYETGAGYLEKAIRLSPTQSGRSFYQRLYGRNALITAYQLAQDEDAAARVMNESREIELQARAAGLINHPQMLHAIARLESLDGDEQTAIDLLEAAVDMGWRSVLIENPPEADHIYWLTVAENHRYQALMQQVREDVARMRTRAASAGLFLTPIQVHGSN